MDLKAGKILVTGADGFIGSHLVEHLVEMGCDVRAFVLYNSFNSWGWLDRSPEEIRRSIEIFAGDIRDPHGVRTAMHDCAVVFHLAALISIPFSYHSPDAYVQTNVTGTLNILEAARELKPLKIIHTSTSEVYGTARYVPIDEDHPLQAQSPYAASKLGGDHLALSYARSFDTPVAVIRPFNTYGPRQSARAVIPTIITQILNGAREIQLGSLHPTRDFNFIADIVAGFIDVAQADATTGEVVNVGGSVEIGIGRLAELLIQIMGADTRVMSDPQRIRPEQSEVERLYADSAKAERLTGWKPEYHGEDGFSRGLEKTIAWFSRPDNLKQYKAGLYNI